MFDPRTPIFTRWEDGDFEVFESLDEALAYAEPWDVCDGDQTFDADGRRVRIVAQGVERTRWTVAGGTTLVDWSASGELAVAEFASMLRDCILRVGPERYGITQDAVAEMSLTELVAVVHGGPGSGRYRKRRGRS